MKAQEMFCWGVSVYKETTARYAAETTAVCCTTAFGANQAFGRNGIELLSKKKIVMARSVFLRVCW